MSTNNESIGKTFAVVVALCLVCAIIVSFAAVQLRPLQQANKAKDIQSNILVAAGIGKVENVSETFNNKIEVRLVNMKTGESFASDSSEEVQAKVNAFDFEKSKFDPKLSFALAEKGITDIAGIHTSLEQIMGQLTLLLFLFKVTVYGA